MNTAIKKIGTIIPGGDSRQESCYNGVVKIENADIILVQDGARPFVKQNIISNSISDAVKYGASVVGVPVKDTIKISGKNNFILKAPKRDTLWIIQTPQVFKAEILREAHKKAKLDNFMGTDDASLVERIGHKVKITMGDYNNIKITTPDDLLLARQLIDQYDEQ